jgi:hypothetical protein
MSQPWIDPESRRGLDDVVKAVEQEVIEKLLLPFKDLSVAPDRILDEAPF